MSEPPRVNRNTARVLLIDERGRVLLFRIVDPLDNQDPVWITPGGGIEPHEDLVSAALRELCEETGLSTDAASLGPPVAVARGDWDFRGTAMYSVDSYFVLHVTGFEPEVGGWTDLERELHSEWRWWTCDEIEAATEVIYPGGLSKLARQLTGGARPEDPVELPWVTGPKSDSLD